MDEDTKIENKELLDKISEVHNLVKDIDTRLVKLEKNNEKIKEERNDRLQKFYEYKINNSDINEEEIRENIEKMKDLSSEEKREIISKTIINHDKEMEGGFFSKIRNAITKEVNIDPGRLLALSDGIFGMVLTLLAFGIGLPSIMLKNYHDFEIFIQSIIPSIGVVIISFIVIGNFWISHHQYVKIKNMNVGFLWLNIIYLASISFIPFTTSIIGTYGNYFIADLLFGLNILITLIIFHTIMYVGSTRNYIENEIIEKKRYIIRTSMELIILTIIIILLNSFISVYFVYLFLLLPLISITNEYRMENYDKK